MRLLMFHVDRFWHRRNEAPDAAGTEIGESLLVWIHSEPEDESDQSKVIRKMVKNIRWLAQKNDCTHVILHSFAHLDERKAQSDIADAIIEATAERLSERGFHVHIVPFGEFYEFSLHVKGPSLAKVFKHIT